ncbi:hypothetical protein B0H13DRAFT_1883896 [Mycena leptocephala]|nr:hypothetical protein B0H13DRAFT_1883896 [Mycena leptocephala]
MYRCMILFLCFQVARCGFAGANEPGYPAPRELQEMARGAFSPTSVVTHYSSRVILVRKMRRPAWAIIEVFELSLLPRAWGANVKVVALPKEYERLIRNEARTNAPRADVPEFSNILYDTKLAQNPEKIDQENSKAASVDGKSEGAVGV